MVVWSFTDLPMQPGYSGNVWLNINDCQRFRQNGVTRSLPGYDPIITRWRPTIAWVCRAAVGQSLSIIVPWTPHFYSLYFYNVYGGSGDFVGSLVFRAEVLHGLTRAANGKSCILLMMNNMCSRSVSASPHPSPKKERVR